MQILAHRGASLEAPENTRAAIRRAWEQGADGVEVDLRLTRDGAIVLMHDASTLRTTGQDLAVAESRWEELSKLDAGLWKHRDWAGESIPLLHDVLRDLPPGRRVVLDVKCGIQIGPALKAQLDETVSNSDRVLLVGPDREVMASLKHLLSAYPVYWNRSRRWNPDAPSWSTSIGRWVSEATEAGLDGLGLDVRVGIDEPTMTSCRGAGLGVFAWTVNDPAEAVRLDLLGVTCLATDVPGPIRDSLRGD